MKTMISPSAAWISLSTARKPLLEFTAKLRPRDQRTEIEGQELLVLQPLGHVAIDDTLRQALDDGCLADTRFADQHRVVLGAAGKYLHGAADFLVATDYGVQFALLGRFGEVARVLLQRIIGFLRAGRFGLAAPDAAFRSPG